MSTPSYIIEMMENEWEKAVAYTDNLIEEIRFAPFSERIKSTIIAALKCNKSLIKENYEQTQKIQKLKTTLERIRDCDWVITLPDRMDAVREIAREALE